ncbi:UNVERIFIED_CONTAM: hypothetical protein PYX00_001989 [Menopon gallinae]|uniref:Galactose mutarotase n=1 Tax=Menopon gallinae TaxID=328185 RepID=A0AAW2IFH4_9NEOP
MASGYEPCPPPVDPFVDIVEDGFGFYTDVCGNKEIVRRFTFTNQNYLTIQVITYGATITSIKYPDQCGVVEDVVLGYDGIEGYISDTSHYMGAIIGRYANRIAKGHFKINDDDFQLSKNHGEHHIHGGFFGFDKVNWKSDLQGKKLVLTYLSQDGEEGYPGELLVSVSYQMTTDNSFFMEMRATTSKPTPINLTNHTYFNLAGHTTGAKGLMQHVMNINADRIVTTDDLSIPTGCLQNVTGTLWDLRIPRKLGTVIQHVPYGGFDQCMCIHKTDDECMTFNARVVHPESGRILEVYSNQPGVQFYTANDFPRAGRTINSEGEIQVETTICPIRVCPICGYMIKDADFENPSEESCPEEKESALGNQPVPIKTQVRLIGKGATEYFYQGGFTLMTGKFPDSVHRKNFPNTILRPGEMYCHKVRYKFSLYEDVVLEPEDFDDAINDWEGEAEGEIDEPADVDAGGDDLLGDKLEENGR